MGRARGEPRQSITRRAVRNKSTLVVTIKIDFQIRYKHLVALFITNIFKLSHSVIALVV